MYAIELLKMRLAMVETEINHTKPGELKLALLEFKVMQLKEGLDRLNNKGEIRW